MIGGVRCTVCWIEDMISGVREGVNTCSAKMREMRRLSVGERRIGLGDESVRRRRAVIKGLS
jgi:hypothetical protein